MKIKSGFNVVKKDGHYMILPDNNIKIKDTIYLDEISLFLWNSLKQKELSQNEMLNILLNKFEISTVLALSEIDKFIKILTRNGIIE